MKYIRTKDGRIGKVTHEDNKNYRAMFGRKCPLISKEDIIKQADAIEELCDEFVEVIDLEIEDESFKHYLHNHPISKEKLAIFASLKDTTVYGAIWTDKGLIYVAKMNDKGELELL